LRTIHKSLKILKAYSFTLLIKLLIDGIDYSYLKFRFSNLCIKAFRALRAHILFQLWTFSVCIHCKTKTKKFADFIKKCCVFSKLYGNRILLGSIFLKFRSFINLFWGHVRSYKKFGPDRFSRLNVYRIQTHRQKSKVYR